MSEKANKQRAGGSSNWIDMRNMLSEFNRSLSLIVDKELLLSNIVVKIKQIVSVEKVSVFLMQHDTDKFLPAASSQPEEEVSRNTLFSAKDKLINWFSVNESLLVVSRSPSILHYFSPEEQELIRTMQSECIYPLKVMNRLTGLVFIGRKNDRADYSQDELDLLALLLDQAAVAIENAVLYEEQSARIKKMYRADRLAILGQLAAGAAHEIRNPLTAIRSTMQYLGKEMKGSDKAEMIDELMEEVDRINKIVQGLLSFAKPTELETARIDTEALIRETLSLVNNLLKKQSVAVNYRNLADDPVIVADPAQLKQVFLNILLNAVEAMAESNDKTVNIVLENSRPVDMRSRYLIVSFEDNGKGVETENIENVFNPFYTTKKEGTGLGLPISYGIINKHNGEMELTSRPGAGTKLVIKLPQALK
ncbi:MAG: GAF domain-containing protein [Culturomica sp.]|nr:GAF domain-containing protein [Culturomica sp.]